MKKTLVALAAVAATSAFAQSSVTLYGLFDISYGVTKSEIVGNPSAYRKTTGLQEGTTAGNRLGFRGVEDLGGGMKAGFVAEVSMSAITTDTFGNRLSTSGHTDTNRTAYATGGAYLGQNSYSTGGSSQNRQTYVYLTGGWGELRAGYQYTNMYTVSSLSGYLGGFEGMSGSDVAHTWGSAGVGGARASGLTYISPVFSGFKVTVQYGGTTNPAFESDNGSLGTNQNKRTSVLVDYGNGPFKASVAHTRMKTQSAGGVTTTPALTQVGASYDFGIAKVMGTYNDGDNDAGVDVKSYQLGVSVPFGAFNVFGTFGKSEYSPVQSGLACYTSTCSVEDVKQRQFGVTYTLSKRTMLYVATGTTKATAPSTLDKKATDTRFGVRHTF